MLTISISAIFQTFASFIQSSGVAAKFLGWITTIGFSGILTYVVWFEHHRKYKRTVKKIFKIILTIFIVWLALTFASEAGMLPPEFPIKFVW